MEQIFDAKDLTCLMKNAESMHDCFIKSIELVGQQLIVIYDQLENHYAPYHKVTVTYHLDDIENDCTLYIYEVKHNSLKYCQMTIEELSNWKMLMFKYDVDIFGEFTLHFNIEKGRKCRNAKLCFTPSRIQYQWA